jgi:hypothetical protein
LVCTELSEEATERRNTDEANQDDAFMAYDPTASTSSFSSSSCSSTLGTPRDSSSGPNADALLDSDMTGAEDVPKSKKFSIPFLAKSANSSKTSISEDSNPTDLEVRPTREWYALLAGLLTRAVLEGYLLKGWKGPQVAEAILSIGLIGDKEKKAKKSKKSLFSRKHDEDPSVPQCEDLPAFLIPDDLPLLSDAAATLFSRSTNDVKETSPDPVQEYTAEMEKRLSEVCGSIFHHNGSV